MQVTKQDLNKIANLLKGFKKGTFSLQGDEMLAMVISIKWLSDLYDSVSGPPQLPPPPVVPQSDKVTPISKGKKK
jgi:hypothetical protein